MTRDVLDSLLWPLGLQQLGDCPDGTDTITLIGPDEPRFWPLFCDSPEYRDGAADPMDRWSQRVISEVAARLNAEPLFPFDGPPFEPFFTWATKTGRFWPSPIGFLVHDQTGLIASFRGAIRWQVAAVAGSGQKPCITCAQPCATACPVGAFDDGYNVTACKTHVGSAAGMTCRTQGCLARSGCPVGQGHRLPAQAAFHMGALL